MREDDLLSGLLKSVSRSFYLTLRVLPRAVRPQIGLAYLLARTSDTLTDSGSIPAEKRLEALKAFRARIRSESAGPIDLGDFVTGQPVPAEGRLLGRANDLLSCLARFPRMDQAEIRGVLTTIIGGQELDLVRFGQARSDAIVSLETEGELRDYTYRVAGCVGEFWTNLCRSHLFPKARIQMEEMLERGRHFGQGLQLVNILRDLPKDLLSGRCYLPRDLLAAAGLVPNDLLVAANEARFRNVFNPMLMTAGDLLADGWSYIDMIPRRQVRVRLACAWPVLIGRQTLQALAERNVLGSERIKVSRLAIRRIMVRTLLVYPFRWAWRRQFSPLRLAASRVS